MNAKKLLSTLLSAAMAVSMLAGCFGGGGNKNYSDEAADAANAAQSTVVFATDATLAKSLQDALADGLTQLDEIDDAMEADENLKSLLTSGYDLDVVAEQGEDAEAAAKAIAEKYILSIVSGKKAEGKIAMVLHDGNGYYYVAVLTYGSGGSGSGGGAGGGSGSGDDGNHPGGGDDDKPGPDDDENSMYDVTVTWEGDGTVTINGEPCKSDESVSLRSGAEVKIVASDSADGDYVFAYWTGVPAGAMQNGNECIISSLDSDLDIVAVYKEKGPETYTVTVNCGENGSVDKTSGKVSAETSFEFTVSPNAGYEANVSTDNGDLSNTGNKWTLSNVNGDATVTVSFTPIEYNVTVNCGENGSVDKTSGKVSAETPFEFTVSPNAGYEANVSTDNGKLSNTGNKWTLSNVNGDATVTVTFKKTVHTVTVKWNYEQGNVELVKGSSTPIIDGFTTTVNDNGSVTIKVDAAKGYKVQRVVTTTGTALTQSGDQYTLSNIISDITINVTFKTVTPKITGITIDMDKQPKNFDCEYLCYEHFDPKNMVITVTYDPNTVVAGEPTTKDIPVTQSMIDSKAITWTWKAHANKQNLYQSEQNDRYWVATFTITYQSKSADVDVRVRCYQDDIWFGIWLQGTPVCPDCPTWGENQSNNLSLTLQRHSEIRQ